MLARRDTHAGDVTVVIPTTSDDVRTLASLPDALPVEVVREGTLNEARNRGVRAADTPWIVLMDDDLAHPERTFADVCSMLGCDTVLGVADWDFGLVAGRVMGFHVDAWRDIGGFDERLGSHMGDTKFALDALRAGYDLERIPRHVFHHEPHERSITAVDRLWRLAYCAFTHPGRAPQLARGVIG